MLTARRAAALITAALAVPLASLAAAAPAAAHVATPRQDRPTLSARRSGPAEPLTLQQAAARARATRRPIVVSSMTTANSETVASPHGGFTTTESLLPQRAQRGGRWVPINPALRARGTRFVTAATPDLVSLSAGGTSPLAVMSSYGRTLTLSWPGKLPAPRVSGATATYPGVPGVGDNLIVTVSPDGTVSTIIEVTSAAAAASSALASLTTSASAPGLRMSADSAGNLAWKATPAADPAFAADAPRMWDSARLPAGTATVTDPASGQVLTAGSGLPANSGIGGPGAAARVTNVPVSVSGSTITLSPPASALTGRGVVYPVYIDPAYNPTNHAGAWTQIDSGLPSNTGNWNETGCENGNGGPCLQTGYCDPTGPYFDCGSGIGVTRTLFRMNLQTGLPTNLTVAKADLYLEDVWTPVCSAQPIQLWATANINGNNKPDWSNYASNWNNNGSNLQDESFEGFGDSLCGSKYGYSQSDVTFGTDASGTITGGSATNLIHTLQTDLDASTPATSQTFGLRASNESQTACDWDYSTNACTGSGTAWEQWRQWMNSSSDIELQFTWYNPPTVSNPGSNPGGACHQSSSDPAVIGNDDINDLYASVSDADGETALTTTFKVYAQDSGNLEKTLTIGSESGTVQSAMISRTTIQNWQANGSTTAYEYYYTIQVQNGGQSSGAGDHTAQSTTYPQDCYFLYDPTQPPAPLVSGMPSAVVLGSSYTVTFNPDSTTYDTTSTLTCPGGTDCPASYTYQIGDRAPVTVNSSSAGWDSSTDSWTGTVTIPVLGPFTFAVSDANAAGNLSGLSGPGTVSSAACATPPCAPVADGYYSDGANPDVLFTGTGSAPSLWLAPGTGQHSVGTPVDIGSLGTGVFGGGSDGAADWTGAQILHGNFTGHGVQDLMAYWPQNTKIGSATITAGTGQILAGDGAAVTADPTGSYWGISGSELNISAGSLCDTDFDGCVDEPVDLVAAGNFSQQNIASADLIGILGDPNTGYELDLYTNQFGTPNGYNYCTTFYPAGNTAPGGDSWGNYVLASYQPPDTADPHGDPAATVLLALDKTTGSIYAASSPTQATDCQSSSGFPGTWTKLTVPASWPTASQWSAAQDTLLQADVTSTASGPGTGAPEIWTRNGNSITPWSLSGTSLTQQASTSIIRPADEWPLSDGADVAQGPTADTATEIVQGNTAHIIGSGYGWPIDNTFGADLSLNGQATYLVPPAATISPGDVSPTLSVWFQTSNAAGGVIASLQPSALSGGPASVSTYDPVMYVGNNGHLYAEFWDGATQPIESANTVDDGLWHHAVISTNAAGTVETLTIDGQSQGTINGTINLFNSTSGTNPTNLTFGNGYIGGEWPSEPHYVSTGSNGYPGYYFNGQLADITYNPASANLQNTGTASTCLDADSNNYPNNGDTIQLWGCGTTPEQQWQLTPAGQLQNTQSGMCLDANSNNYPNNGDAIQLWSCSTNPEQEWRLG